MSSFLRNNEVTISRGFAGILLSNSGDSSPQEDLVYNNMVSFQSSSSLAKRGMFIAKPDAKILHNTVWVENVVRVSPSDSPIVADQLVLIQTGSA